MSTRTLGCVLGSVLVWMTAVAVHAQTPAPTQSSPTLRWSGDLRLRWQGDFQKHVRAQNVMQYRLRLNLAIPINERVEFGGRLMTGDPRAVTTGGDVNASDFSSRKSISIDQLYASYTPDPRATFVAGKFTNPFVRPTELVWDEDLSLEGLGQKFLIRNKAKSAAFGLNFGEFYVNQSDTTGGQFKRTYIVGAQALVQLTKPTTSGTIAVAVYGIGNADDIYAALNRKPLPALLGGNTNRPNAAKTGYRSDFRIVNVGGQVSRTVGKSSLGLSVDYAMNAGADDERQAVCAVLSYGETRAVRGTRVAVQAFHVESDAVLSAYNNVDFMQSNADGFGLIVNHQPLRNVFIDFVAYPRKYNQPSSLSTLPKTNDYRTRMRVQVAVRF